MISDHHQPYVKAVQEVLPEAEHVRTGLHRARGETTKPIERSHVFTRDRLRAARGVSDFATLEWSRSMNGNGPPALAE